MDEHRPPKIGPGYEVSDVDLSIPLKLGAALLAITLITIFVMIGVFRWLEPPAPGDVALPGAVLPPLAPEGDLTPLPEAEDQLRALRAYEDETLSSYAWMDPARGVVRIPIDRAMRLVVAAEARTESAEERP